MRGKMSDNIYSEVISSLNSSIDNDKISHTLIKNFEELLKRSEELKTKAMNYEKSIYSLKLFSATNTCAEIIHNSLPKLKYAKKRGENPKVLNKLSGLLFDTVKLLEEVESSFEASNIYVLMPSIRNKTFELQQEAEDLGLIKKMSEKIREVSEELRGVFINFAMPTEKIIEE